MSDFLSTTGEFVKMPNCKTPGDCRRVWQIENEGTGLYYMNIFSLTTATPSTIYYTGVVFYIWGVTNGIYQHPIKCTVVSDITFPTNRVHFSTTGAIQTGAVTLLCSPTFLTDLLSSSQNNLLAIYSHEFKMYEYRPTTNTITIEMSIASFAQYGLGTKPVDGWYIIDKNGVKITAYLTYTATVDGWVQYTFEFDFLRWIEIGGAINGILHVDAKYSIIVRNGADVLGTFVFSPDRNFIFEVNLKSIFSSLFEEKMFTSETNPLSSSLPNLIDLTDIFVKKITLTVSMFSPNINRSSDLVFFTTPFKSNTGRGTLERFLPPTDSAIADIVTPFQSIKYLNGVGSILGFVGMFVRNRKTSSTREIISNDNVTTDTVIQVRADNVSFLLYSNKYTSAQFPTVLQLIEQLDETQVVILNKPIKNIGIYCTQVNIMWQAPQGIGQWFFNQEYDETNSVDGTVTIVNDEDNTILNHNIQTKRKLSLKTDLLNLADRVGVSSLIEARQVWIYSYTQQRLLPCKVVTNSMKIKQRDEVTSIIDFEIEIEAGIVL